MLFADFHVLDIPLNIHHQIKSLFPVLISNTISNNYIKSILIEITNFGELGPLNPLTDHISHKNNTGL